MIPSEDPFENAMRLLHPHFPGGMRIDQMIQELLNQRDLYREEYRKASARADKLTMLSQTDLKQ